MSVFKIVLVDDNPVNLQIIGEVLTEIKEYDISFATSGEQLFKSIELEVPDLILLDVMMPKISGFEVTETLKKDPRYSHIPIIFLTALNSSEDVVRGFELGAVDFISKPFNSAVLKVRVKNQLEIKKAKDIITKQRDSLNDLNKTKDKLFSIISHDLRNPFTVITGFSDIMLNHYHNLSEEKILQNLEMIHRSSLASNNLLENLLEWSRLQNGTISIDKRDLDIKLMFEELEDLIEFQAKEKGISLEFKDNGLEKIYADRNSFVTVIRNLITNALKFSHRDSKVIITIEDIENNYTISVEDFGVGVPEEIKTQMFKHQYIESTFGTSQEKGSGLGLNLCQEFVEMHGGKIWVESEVDKGSIFKFSIPKK